MKGRKKKESVNAEFIWKKGMSDINVKITIFFPERITNYIDAAADAAKWKQIINKPDNESQHSQRSALYIWNKSDERIGKSWKKKSY